MTVPAPSVCPTCLGDGIVGGRDPELTTLHRRCPDCCCVNCGQPCTTGLCDLCDAADMYERDLARERGR